MHLLWTLLGMVVGSTMGLNSPPPVSLDAICNGLTAATDIASHAVAIRSQSARNPEIEALRLELLTALSNAGANLRLSLEQGEAYARAGTKVANNVIYPLDRFIAGELETKHLPEIARSLDKPITQLLENVKEMHTELEKVQMKTQTHGQRVDRAIAEAQDAIAKSRCRRKRSTFWAGALAFVSFALPPAAPLVGTVAVGLAVDADAYHKDVVAGLTAIQPWYVFAENLRIMRDVVGRAQDVAEEQIRFWSQMRDQVEQLKDSRANWLEDLSSEWMATKLLAEWKGVAQQYSQCAHTTSDAHRFLDAHSTANVPAADHRDLQELLGPIHEIPIMMWMYAALGILFFFLVRPLQQLLRPIHAEILMWMHAALDILFFCLARPLQQLLRRIKGGSSTHRLHGGSCDAANEADDQHPGTFVIYFPNNDWSSSLRSFAESFTTNDLTCLQASLGLGALLSVHDSTEAASWIEDHWDSDLLTSIRHGGWGGPLSCMLSPEESALAIFGSYENPTVVNMAQSLTKASGLPVVIRSACDNPALTLLSTDIDPQVHFGTSGENNDDRQPTGDGRPRGSGTGERCSGADQYDQAPNRDDAPQGSGGGGGSGGGDDAVNETSPNHGPSDTHSSGDGDGGGGGGSPSTVDGRWESPLHRTCVKLALKPDANRAYAVAISSTFKFTINRDTDIPIDLNDLTRPLSQPEAIAALDFQIETRPRETQVDRSYASIGFVVHREESIAERKFLHRGFDLPLKIYKQSTQRQNQRGFQGAFGLSQGPLSAATFSYARTNGTTLEATDNKVMPRCCVKHEPGDAWDNDKKSYSSYNVAYQVQNLELDAQHPDYPLEVRVGMGINIRPPGSKTPLPKISFVNRNQVLIWVSDPTSKARIRGIMVLMSSYLDNIRTDEELSIYEKAVVELASLTAPQAKAQGDKAGTISLSIAQVQTQSVARFNKLLPLFSTKLGQRSPVCSPADIGTHEYLARGWDANNNEWRQVLWPALDKDFRAADFEGKSPVWKIQCPWKNAATNAVYTSP